MNIQSDKTIENQYKILIGLLNAVRGLNEYILGQTFQLSNIIGFMEEILKMKYLKSQVQDMIKNKLLKLNDPSVNNKYCNELALIHTDNNKININYKENNCKIEMPDLNHQPDYAAHVKNTSTLNSKLTQLNLKMQFGYEDLEKPKKINIFQNFENDINLDINRLNDENTVNEQTAKLNYNNENFNSQKISKESKHYECTINGCGKRFSIYFNLKVINF